MAYEHKEIRLHAAAVRYLRTVCPDCLVWHVANGGLRSKNTARLMKALGVLPGVFDLVLMAPGARVFFLEAKAEGGRLSDDQQWFKGELIKFGFPYVIFRSLDDLREFILQNHLPNRIAKTYSPAEAA